jgi:hypothetical protein
VTGMGPTTRWEHARIEKPVLSMDGGRWLTCCWFECDRQGFDLHKAVVHDHARGLSCDHPLSKHVQYIFCSDACKGYWINSHRSMGNLPAGERHRVW